MRNVYDHVHYLDLYVVLNAIEFSRKCNHAKLKWIPLNSNYTFFVPQGFKITYAILKSFFEIHKHGVFTITIKALCGSCREKRKIEYPEAKFLL